MTRNGRRAVEDGAVRYTSSTSTSIPQLLLICIRTCLVISQTKKSFHS